MTLPVAGEIDITAVFSAVHGRVRLGHLVNALENHGSGLDLVLVGERTTSRAEKQTHVERTFQCNVKHMDISLWGCTDGVNVTFRSFEESTPREKRRKRRSAVGAGPKLSAEEAPHLRRSIQPHPNPQSLNEQM